jgi:hypothetical protein
MKILFLILSMFFHSTESGFGSDIFDVGATDFTRTSSTIERVRLYLISYRFANTWSRYSPNEMQI